MDSAQFPPGFCFGAPGFQLLHSRFLPPSLAFVHELRSAPNNAAIWVDDEWIAEILILTQAESLPNGNFVIGVQFALNEYLMGAVV